MIRFLASWPVVVLGLGCSLFALAFGPTHEIHQLALFGVVFSAAGLLVKMFGNPS